MKNKLKILFMGTPEFALGILQKIYSLDYDLCGIVTAPDKKAGRGKKRKESAVKKWAVKKELPIYQPTNLKSDQFYDQLKALNPDLIIVVAFRMLPKKVWDFPNYGTINLHASLLPDYRGAAPIHWAIINGETKTGVTTFFINENIDTGKIINFEEIEIDENDNVASLHDKLMDIGADLVIKTLDQIYNENYTTTKQKLSENDKKAPKLDKNTSKINWDQNQHLIYNFIRGLSPFPCSWCYLNDEFTCKIFKATKTNMTSDCKPGTIIIQEQSIYVSTSDFNLQLCEVQFQNRKMMTAREAINGKLIKQNDVFK